jgi:GTP-binding protein
VKHPLQQAEFFLTAASDEQLPPPGPPEIAFAGRSNAGKSSAINALANRTRLAFTSKTPGRTQQINFFRLRSGALLADLPGYGYAAVPLKLKRHWQDFLARYVATRQSLVGLVLVVDARHGLADLDLGLLDGFLPSGRPALILATKMDKLAAQGQRRARDAIVRAVAEAFPVHAERVTVVGFSATRRIGIEAAEALIGSWAGGED